MAVSTVPEQDHVDKLLARIAESGVADIDLDVEGIVDRIGSIHRRIKRAQEATLREYGLTPADWGVLTTLRLGNEYCRSSPGELASDLELSSGAMTSRLDRLEQAGLVRRLPDPEDRRGIIVRLTDAGRDTVDGALAGLLEREQGLLATLAPTDRGRLISLLRALSVAAEQG